MASVAVFLSMSGGAYALTIPRNSVGSRQLRERAVTRTKLAVATQVRDGSLRARGFRRSDLPAGPRGARGVTGARGSTGSRGATGATGRPGRAASPRSTRCRPAARSAAWSGRIAHSPSIDASNDFGVDAVLPIPAPSALADAAVAVNVGATTATSTDTNAGCTGTAAAPTAPAGVVCVYVSGEANALNLQGLAANGAAGMPCGFKLVWNSAATGDTFVDAVWAYTAP